MTSDLESALDEIRRSLSGSQMRQNSVWIRGLWTAPHAVAIEPDRGQWMVKVQDSRAWPQLKRLNEEGTLAVFTDLIWYGLHGQKPNRCGALTVVQVKLSSDAQYANAVGEPQSNQALIDLLRVQGVLITRDKQGRIRLTVEGDVAVRTEVGARLAENRATANTLATYLDHRTFPAVLRNPLLLHFVHPKLMEYSASERNDEVEASERRPKVDGPSSESLDPDQLAAVEAAIENSATIIDGPPGTGKTQVICAIARRMMIAGKRLIITSTERSALSVARRRLAEIAPTDDSILIGTPDEIARAAPTSIGHPDADLLLIDECSRMPLAVALPLLTRARAVALIGDDKQMRPDEPSETVLDRATKLRLPRTTLRFHYRSRDRSLITPSNILAYDMALRTAPNPRLTFSDGLRLIAVGGTTAKISAQRLVNQAEADAIVKKIIDIRKNGDLRSIGVITANRGQQRLIEALLRGRKLPDDENEPMFILPSQKAQGEERDIILISMVYDGMGPQATFGSFNEAGSVERMNVMLSRCRSEMWIYTSFRRESRRDIDKPCRGRIVYEGVHAILDVMVKTETRLATPPAIRNISAFLDLEVDNLGIVYGFRAAGDEAYRIGLIVTDDIKDPDHWDAIEKQLATLGWNTVRTDVADLENRSRSTATMVGEAIDQLKPRAR